MIRPNIRCMTVLSCDSLNWREEEIVGGLQHFACGKCVVEWKIIFRPHSRETLLNIFYNVWKVSTLQFPVRYDNISGLIRLLQI